MSHYRLLASAVPLAVAAVLFTPGAADAGWPGYRTGYAYRNGYGYGAPVGGGIYISGPYGSYPYGYYGPTYPSYAPGYYAPTYVSPGKRALTPQVTEPRLANERTPDTRVNVTVRVPIDAEVWFGGQKTRQTGALRHFVSPPLTPGQEYRYEVRAGWTEAGKEVVQARLIAVHPGSRQFVDFTQPEAEAIASPKPVSP
jgi:uncharacterized protein (TIGR03000 family)